MNQIGAIVCRYDLHPGRERGRDLADALLHGVDNAKCIFSVPHHDDPPRRLTLPVQLRDAAAQVGTDRDAPDVSPANAAASPADPDSNPGDVVSAAEITQPANRV